MFNIVNWKLEKIYSFNNFSDAMEFVNKVANISETIWHHPDMNIFDYKFVKIILFTHTENKITQKDEYLASLIDKIK